MMILIDGEWSEMSGDWPVTVEYDPTMGTNPAAIGFNRGCPPGYVAQAVAPERSWWGGSTGQTATFVCRRADDQYVNNPALIAAESGPDAVDASIQAVADAARTTVEAAASAGGAVSRSLVQDVAPWLIGGLVAYLVLSKGLDKLTRA